MALGSIYDIKFVNWLNKEICLEEYRNKIVLVVNVASLCGFTVQYRALQKLYEKYRDKGLIILAFPCNQFGGQEPQGISEIIEHAKKTFGVTFPIMQKIDVNGEFQAPIFKYLKKQKQFGLGFEGIRWNFEKFLIDRDGRVVERFSTVVLPESIEPYIQKLID